MEWWKGRSHDASEFQDVRFVQNDHYQTKIMVGKADTSMDSADPHKDSRVGPNFDEESLGEWDSKRIWHTQKALVYACISTILLFIVIILLAVGASKGFKIIPDTANNNPNNITSTLERAERLHEARELGARRVAGQDKPAPCHALGEDRLGQHAHAGAAAAVDERGVLLREHAERHLECVAAQRHAAAAANGCASPDPDPGNHGFLRAAVAAWMSTPASGAAGSACSGAARRAAMQTAIAGEPAALALQG